jgi:excisionase family DNA binding protein
MATADATASRDGQLNGGNPPARTSSNPEPLIDSEKAAAIIGIHPKTLQKMARSGEIRGVHVGKLWRFRASSIEEWINQRLAS